MTRDPTADQGLTAFKALLQFAFSSEFCRTELSALNVAWLSEMNATFALLRPRSKRCLAASIIAKGSAWNTLANSGKWKDPTSKSILDPAV